MKRIMLTVFFLMNTVCGWQNWAGNVTCTPQQIVAPTSLEEVKAIIRKARHEGRTVRAIGTGHSWTTILCTDGYLVNTDNLNKVLSIDADNGRITVQAGIKLNDLITVLQQNNLALSNQPAITQQSIAGVVSTGTHGTGKTGTMASFVEKIQLVAADGQLYEFDKQTNNNVFKAACLSVGSLGIVYALTIKCEPLFTLKHDHYQITWDKFVNAYERLYQKHDYFWFFVDFHQDRVTIDIWDRVKKHDEVGWPTSFKETLFNMISRVTLKLSLFMPRIFNMLVGSDQDDNTITDSYKALSGLPSAYYLEEEIAVAQDTLIDALKALKSLIHAYKEKGVAIDGVLGRFVKGEQQILLSPTRGKDVVFLSVTTPVHNKYYPFFKDMYSRLLTYAGCPHWGKINYLNNNDARMLYGDDLKQFITTKKRLDPSGMFSNAFTQRVFGR